MASAFDGLSNFDADFIRRRLLAGDTMKAIRDAFADGEGKSAISAKRMRELRDEFFEPLIADPDKVKELAAGPVLNALEINRPKRPIDRHTRMARPRPVQIEMFPA